MTPWITTKDKNSLPQNQHLLIHPYSNGPCYESPTLLVKGVSRVQHDMSPCLVSMSMLYSKYPQTPPKHNMIRRKHK